MDTMAGFPAVSRTFKDAGSVDKRLVPIGVSFPAYLIDISLAPKILLPDFLFPGLIA